MIDLTNRVALVTGGSRGIGRAISLALANAGAAVAVNYLSRALEAEETVAEIHAGGRTAMAIAADVSVATAVKGMVDEIADKLGPIDVLINNAGVATVRGLDDLTEDDFDRAIAVNLKSAFLCIKAVLPSMRARGWGRIINMSSVAARAGGAIGAHYNASKAGLEGLTRAYASRLAAGGVTVNAVAPALIDTEMAAPLKQAGYAARIPVGRFGAAEEVASATLMLIDNAFITGQTIPVKGGMLFT
ncbi:MAG TPA: SDR family NAD(P)-dependent oxidoreductase [Roseiarcus sp.]|nr:SDR family NAD(P)-dependent oxidoreductase [Roseiarcus sp.]